MVGAVKSLSSTLRLHLKIMRLLLLLFLAVATGPWASAQIFNRDQPDGQPRKAIVIPLHEDIDFVSGAMLQRKFQQAIDDGAEVIILDINSPGGLTMVTFELMDMVLDAEDVETVAWVQRDALSGASMLALACDKIFIEPGARIGDAGEIVAGPDGAYRYTEAKSRSVLAQKVRDTARATGRPVALAEKLVDQNLIVYSATDESGETVYVTDRELESMDDAAKAKLTVGKPLREAGKDMFFTVNGERAVELGFADATVGSQAEVVEKLNVSTPMPVYAATGMDKFVWVMNSNFMAFVLIAVGLIALLVEASAPGIGIGALVSILSFAMFFWARFLGGTSGWLEVTLFVVGLAFIALEIFVVPGFGVPGITGAAMLIGSLVMASRRSFGLLETESWTDVGWDILTPIGALAAFMVAAIVLTSYMDVIPGLSSLALGGPQQTIDDTPVQTVAPVWERVAVGATGIADSPLRPAGRIEVDNEYLEATTRGEFIAAGTPIEVVSKEGSRVFVRSVPA